MFCLGMVLNQGQLFIVVSDWESYLGSPFSLLSVWEVVFVSGPEASPSFCMVYCFVGIILNKGEMYAHHAALWSSSFDGRDTGI